MDHKKNKWFENQEVKSRWFIGCRKSLDILETLYENSHWIKHWCLEKTWRQSEQRLIEGKMTKYYCCHISISWEELYKQKKLLYIHSVLAKWCPSRHEASKDICQDIAVKKNYLPNYFCVITFQVWCSLFHTPKQVKTKRIGFHINMIVCWKAYPSVVLCLKNLTILGLRRSVLIDFEPENWLLGQENIEKDCELPQYVNQLVYNATYLRQFWVVHNNNKLIKTTKQ